MSQSLFPIRHDGVQDDDEARSRDAREYIKSQPQIQLVAELLHKLRALSPPWWSPTFTYAEWPPLLRMTWLRHRPDVRQRIVSLLTGLPKNAARNKTPDFQAGLVASVVEAGDVDRAAFEQAFEPLEMATYGVAHEFWTAFRRRFPWEDPHAGHQKFLGWALRALVTDRSSLDPEIVRKPILTYVELRGAIDASIWHECIPVELRVMVDEARIRQERARPKEPFHARHELAIVSPEVLATHIPARELLPVFDVAEKNCAFFDKADDRGSGEYPISRRDSLAPPLTLVSPEEVPAISVRDRKVG